MKLFLSLFLLLLLSGCQTTGTDFANERNSSIVDALYNEDLPDEQLQETDDEEGLTSLVEDGSVTEDQLLLPIGYDNLWLKLAEGFEFEVPDNARIAKQRELFLSNPNYLKQISQRAAPFLYLIVKQIEAKNLPLELVLLPIVESAFDPFAYSRSSASGLWQFMPATGSRFGLKQDWWYDGRRDVYASTDAALRYMETLNKYFGNDWLHTFAAYNSGEGRVDNAMRHNQKRNKPSDYWNLSLPKETEEYVPKLLALVDILRHHEQYGIKLPFIANKQVLTHVNIGAQLDLSYAAKLADLSVAEMQLLNPAFNHWATPPDGPHRLLVPTRIARTFSNKLNNSDKNKRIQWTRYTVRNGDSLSVIARKNGTTSNVLQQINDLNGSVIKAGQPLLIPIADKSQQSYLYSQAQNFERAQGKNGSSKREVKHTIVEGDTLWDISRMYKVTAKEIAQWNRMNSKKTLQLGQQLTIWKTAAERSKNQQSRSVTYKVRSGDSLGAIAEKFNVKPEDLVRWNELFENKYIHPGQNIKVYLNSLASRS